MTQPPDDRDPLAPEDPQPPASEPPERDDPADQATVAWTPPPTPDAGAGPEAAPDAPAPDAPAADSPIISAAPLAAATTATPGEAPDAPIVGWDAPEASLQPSAVAGYYLAGVGARLVAFFLDILVIFLAGFIVIIVIAVVAGPALVEDANALSLLYAIVITGFEFLYFVGFWTGGRRATPGMRILGLEVVATATGRTIDVGSSIIRWAALTFPVGLLAVIPDISTVVSYVAVGWTIALLLSTAISPLNQGIHDRLSKTSVLRRGDASPNGVAIGCAILAGLFILLVIVLPIAVFAIFGDAIEEMLIEIGQSI